jgi:hypothetical protein
MGEKGSVAFLLFGVLFSMSIAFLGIYLMMEYTVKEMHKGESRARARMELVERAEEVTGALLNDPTPLSDSLIDPVWGYIDEQNGEGTVRMSLADVSSLYGINWLRKDVLAHGNLLKYGKTPEELQQYRWESGLQSNALSAYADFFEDGSLERFFTLHNYFNLNISDEFSIEKLIQVRTGDEHKGAEFRQKVQSLWSASEPGKPKMVERDELESFMGRDFEELFPIVNAEPVFNVHFVPEEILRQVFTLEYHAVSLGAVEYIIGNRSCLEWEERDLAAIIGAKYKNTFLHHYFGVVTWFWRLEITKADPVYGEMKLKWVLARIPQPKPGDAAVKIRLVEEEFAP